MIGRLNKNTAPCITPVIFIGFEGLVGDLQAIQISEELNVSKNGVGRNVCIDTGYSDVQIIIHGYGLIDGVFVAEEALCCGLRDNDCTRVVQTSCAAIDHPE